MPETPPPNLQPPAIPVQALSYGSPERQRPALVTAMGVLSIVLASGAILLFGIMTLYAGIGVMMSQFSAAAPATSTATPAVTVTGTFVTEAGPRTEALNALAAQQPLSSSQLKLLEQLLAQDDSPIFVMLGQQTAPLSAQISESGTLPAQDDSGTGHYFVLGTGRIEVYDDHAAFYPADGDEPVRVDGAAASGAFAGGALSPAQTEAVIKQVQSMLASQAPGPNATPAQLQALRLHLSSPQQMLLAAADDMQELTSQIQSVYGGAQQPIIVQTSQGMIQVEPKGTVVSTTSFGAGGGMGGPRFTISRAASTAALVCSLLSALAAIYLLIAGIFMLRQSLVSRRLHYIYAWIKIPLVLATVLSWIWLWRSFMSNMNVGGTSVASMLSYQIIITAAIAIALGWMYPIALLIALNAKSMKEYYDPRMDTNPHE